MNPGNSNHRSLLATDTDPMRGVFEGARCGLAGARDQLIRHYLSDLLRRAGNRLRAARCVCVESDDIVQDTLLSVFQHIDQFRPGDYQRFEHYMHKTLNNKVRDRLRHACQLPTATTSADGLPFEGPDQHQDLAARELWTAYRALVDQLPERTRIAVVLRIERHLSYGRVAAVSGCPNAHAARMVVSRAMRRIAALMDEWLAAGGGRECDAAGSGPNGGTLAPGLRIVVRRVRAPASARHWSGQHPERVSGDHRHHPHHGKNTKKPVVDVLPFPEIEDVKHP